MHLLHSLAIGTEVIDEAEHRIHGTVADILLDPDRGTIAAIFVRGATGGDMLALQPQDILSWGQRIHIREPESLGPLEDIIRLQPLLSNKRRILRQHIRTKNGIPLGRCIDIQFNTDRFDLEWIFPRRFLQKGIPLPASDILEITEHAIIVKDQMPKEEKDPVEEVATNPTLHPVITPASS